MHPWPINVWWKYHSRFCHLFLTLCLENHTVIVREICSYLALLYAQLSLDSSLLTPAWLWTSTEVSGVLVHVACCPETLPIMLRSRMMVIFRMGAARLAHFLFTWSTTLIFSEQYVSFNSCALLAAATPCCLCFYGNCSFASCTRTSSLIPGQIKN